MTTPEKLHLPEPLKVKPSIAKYLDKLEDDGNTIWAFEGSDIIEHIFYLHLMKKYKSKCIPKGTKRTIGIQIPLKVKYTELEESEISVQFHEIGKNITDCVKRGEQMIMIPLSYVTANSAHYNMLVYKIKNNAIEHFEPHGGEYAGNLKLQETSKKIILSFVDILNTYLTKDDLHKVAYVEASQVCPYIHGLQDLEGKSNLRKNKVEPLGYCGAWGLFFAELNLKNPNATSEELLDNIYKYLTTKESGPDYLKRVIRGYAGYIYQAVDSYLQIFFKPRIELSSLIGREGYYKHYKKMETIKDVINVLIDLEIMIASDPSFDYQKELKMIKKEYKQETHGKTKEEERWMRDVSKKLKTMYYKKRILQNYEEYKKYGHISEPVFDSPKDIKEEDIKNLSILEKGHLHEFLTKEKQKYKEEIKNQPWYIEEQKRKKELQERRKKEGLTGRTKAKKSSPNNKTKKMLPTKKEANFLQEIIERENIDIKTKEGQLKLIKMLKEMKKNNI